MRLLMTIAFVVAFSANCFASGPHGGGYDGNNGPKRAVVSGAEGNRSEGGTIQVGIDHN